ncbi:MAG: right-handed parallel beta-helix repeat-containing protein [Phycisphaerales bacterium]|nr:MAG: right-handed parallel beta-helix repeat-containing protein [Phycisphaerales bacterium]
MFRLYVCAIVLFGVATSAAQAQTVFYVDADATSPSYDGASWCTAFKYLQDALAVATASDEIRMADGVYLADKSTCVIDDDCGDASDTCVAGLCQWQSPREQSFDLIDGVAIRGGYAGCGAPDPDERDLKLHETILSGDLNGDDHLRGDNSENTYRIINAQDLGDTTVLDGLTVTGANANGFLPANLGGGMLNDASSPVITNCAFIDNTAVFAGGALYNRKGSNPEITGCRFLNNLAPFGAAIRNYASAPVVTDCTFTGNSAENRGAGVYNTDSSDTHLINCFFSENEAFDGAAVYNELSSLTLSNCTITDNHAAFVGGVLSYNASPTIENCILWGNSDKTGTGEAAQVKVDVGTLTIGHSCVQGWTGTLGGAGNHGDDPLFVPGPLGCYYLSQTVAGQLDDSPCVDAGSDDAATLGFDTVTTRGDEAVDTGTVDMGYHYAVTGDPLNLGDFDSSGTVNLFDFAQLQLCFTGEDAPNDNPCVRKFDFDCDADVDLEDYAAFQAYFQD